MKKSPQPANFETALIEIEQLVQQMESQNLSLEDALKAYERGSELVKFAQSKLDDVRQKILVIENNGQSQEYIKNE